jgi:hypothetical protein
VPGRPPSPHRNGLLTALLVSLVLAFGLIAAMASSHRPAACTPTPAAYALRWQGVTTVAPCGPTTRPRRAGARPGQVAAAPGQPNAAAGTPLAQ